MTTTALSGTGTLHARTSRLVTSVCLAALMISAAAHAMQPVRRISLPHHSRFTISVPPRPAPAKDAGEDTGEAKDPGGGSSDAFEWTELPIQPDSRVVYIANAGSDANSGLNPFEPVRTIEKGVSLLRDGYPDHLLFRRGDTWEESFGKLELSGRSGDEPMVIGAYGDSPKRPLILTGTAKRGIWLAGSHLAVTDLEFFAHTYDGAQGAEAGLLVLGGYADILVENCKFRGYKDNVVLNGFNDTLADAAVRGCVSVDAYSKIAHAQGLYANNVDGLLIEACVFDHNGWNEDVPGAEPTIFNHNVYIQTTCSDVAVRDNLIMNAASHGVQLRPGGLCEGNVLIGNAVGILAGNAGDAPPVSVTIRGNAILYGDDIAPDKPRGMGIDLQNIQGGEITYNVLAHNESAQPYGHAIKLHCTTQAPVVKLRAGYNVIYDWQGGLKLKEDGLQHVVFAYNKLQSHDAVCPLVSHEAEISQGTVRYRSNVYHSNAVPSAWFRIGDETYTFAGWKDAADERGSKSLDLGFVAPERSLASYQASVGGFGGREGFIEAARAQSRQAWNPDYAAGAVLEYFLTGFGVDHGIVAHGGASTH